eukprot:1701230-Prymnesium_polylepis.1
MPLLLRRALLRRTQRAELGNAIARILLVTLHRDSASQPAAVSEDGERTRTVREEAAAGRAHRQG